MTTHITPSLPEIVLIRHRTAVKSGPVSTGWRRVTKSRRFIQAAVIAFAFGGGIILSTFAGEIAAPSRRSVVNNCARFIRPSVVVSGRTPAEVEQLKTQNRRLEALVSVLRARANHQKAETSPPRNLNSVTIIEQ